MPYFSIETSVYAFRTERVAKYNQLLRIEEDLGDSACFESKRINDVLAVRD